MRLYEVRREVDVQCADLLPVEWGQVALGLPELSCLASLLRRACTVCTRLDPGRVQWAALDQRWAMWGQYPAPDVLRKVWRDGQGRQRRDADPNSNISVDQRASRCSQSPPGA